MYLYWLVCQIFQLPNRSTDWQSGASFGIQVNQLENSTFGGWGNLLAKWSIGVSCSQCYYLPQNFWYHFQRTTQSILPPVSAHAIPLSLLLYFVLEQFYWFSFLHSVLLHFVWQLTQLFLHLAFNLPMEFVCGDKFLRSYSPMWQYTIHWTWFFLQQQWPVHTALQLQVRVTQLLVDSTPAAAWSVIWEHKYSVEPLTDPIWKAFHNLGGIWNACGKHWSASGCQSSHDCWQANFSGVWTETIMEM